LIDAALIFARYLRIRADRRIFLNAQTDRRFGDSQLPVEVNRIIDFIGDPQPNLRASVRRAQTVILREYGKGEHIDDQ